jgi:tyrosinase
VKLTRRTLLSSSLVIPFSEWVKTAQAAGPFTRYSATSSQGQAMLKDYATAVTKMQQNQTKFIPVDWTFQWYTHCVKNPTGGPDPTAKQAEINRIYGSGSSPNKNLANEMWDTCQAHGGQDEDYFLPWHRMYVYFFERIVRKISGNAQFTLPYWDYTSRANHGVITPEFRQGSLLVNNRNPGVNTGQPIDKGQRYQLNLDALKETGYQQNGPKMGFCADLDGFLHGSVHVFTGTRTNMGAVPYAAQDPVFWAHHCNIDRIWTSWNKNGGNNPTNDSSFMNGQFVFADENGTRVVAKVPDFLQIDALGYTYDALEPAPAGFRPDPLTTRTTLTTEITTPAAPAIATSASLTLTGTRTNVTLRAQDANKPIRTAIQSVASEKRLYLVAKDLSAPVGPGVVYDVFLNLPDSVSGTQANSNYVGSINFFGAGHGEHAGNSGRRFLSLDVTQRGKSLTAQGKPDEPLKISLVASGTPFEAAKPVVGSLTLVAV